GLVLVIVLYALVRSRVSGSYTGGYAGETTYFPSTVDTSPAVQAGAQELRTADPQFEPESFLQKAEMAYLLVKRAYQDRNVHEARAFLSPQLWQQWSAEVNQLIEQHQRPVLENLNVRGMEVLSVS